MTDQPTTPSKALNITLWILQALLAAFMIMAAVMKFMPIEKMAPKMHWMGEAPGIVVRLLGLIDLAGGLGLILPGLLRIKPRLTAWAAMGIVALMISAMIFHVSRGEAPVIGVNIFALLIAAFIAWGRFKKVPLG